MTTATATRPLLDRLILARLLIPGKRLTAAVVRAALAPLYPQPPSLAEVKAALADLLEAGLVAPGPLALTEAGRAEALAFLRLDHVPDRLDWKALKNRFLVPLALGIPPADAGSRARLARPGGLAARVLSRRHDLPEEAGSSLPAAVEALVCKELGFPEEATLAAVRRKVLSRLLGADTVLTEAQLARQLPAHAAGAARPALDALRDAVLRRWLQEEGEEGGVLPAHSTPHTPEGGSADAETGPESDPAEFAATVLAAAAGCPSGWFGGNKVFVSHLHRALRDEPAFARLGLPAFKERLLEAHRLGLLALTRADLVEVMDPADVRESEILHLSNAYHFVLLEGRRP